MKEILPELERKVADNRETVMAAGGLFICGTERHESRRIDNQLRGRAGRQGDPGESRFFLSAEDDLVRLFAGDRIYRILDKLGGVDEEGNEEPIEAGMLSKQIEKAQKKVEEQNFLIRKRVLEYDDVMNEQRRVIYKYRDEVLEGKSIGEEAREEVAQGDRAHDRPVHARRLRRGLGHGRAVHGARPAVPARSRQRGARPRHGRPQLADAIASSRRRWTRYNAREEALGEELMEALERFLLLQTIDERWREHLFDMDYLREGIHLRGFAQIDPLVAYKNEAFTLFGDLMNSVWSDYARMIFNVQVNVEGENGGTAPARLRSRRSQPPAARRARAACPTPAGTARPARARSQRRLPQRGWAPARPRARSAKTARRWKRCRWSSSACSTTSTRSGATTRAGAARARSSRSATAPRRPWTLRGAASSVARVRSTPRSLRPSSA